MKRAIALTGYNAIAKMVKRALRGIRQGAVGAAEVYDQVQIHYHAPGGIISKPGAIGLVYAFIR